MHATLEFARSCCILATQRATEVTFAGILRSCMIGCHAELHEALVVIAGPDAQALAKRIRQERFSAQTCRYECKHEDHEIQFASYRRFGKFS